ncbi:MAG: metallophosphoesterase [Candidatus Hydrothermales bacterium]
MKKFVILSDTHIPKRAKELPSKVLKEIEKSDGLIHAGDFVCQDFYLFLEKNFFIHAVHGNMDEPSLFNLLPEIKIFEIENLKIGLFHGTGAPFGIENRVLKKFQNENLDLIIFGHSHRVFNKKIGNTHLFNPGSATDKIFSIINTFGLIKINGNNFEIEVIRI